MVIFWELWDGTVFFLQEQLASMDFRWFCYPLTITIKYLQILTLLSDHRTRWFFNGFGVIQLLPFNDFQPPDHCFQWISDLRHYWSSMVFKIYTQKSA